VHCLRVRLGVRVANEHRCEQLNLDRVLAKSPSWDEQWLTPLVSVDPPPSKYPGAV